MTRSSARKPRSDATESRNPARLMSPHPFPAANTAAPTAAVGIRNRTASASTTRMPRLPGQRGLRPAVSPRQGLKISHRAIVAKMAAKAATRMTISAVEYIGLPPCVGTQTRPESSSKGAWICAMSARSLATLLAMAALVAAAVIVGQHNGPEACPGASPRSVEALFAPCLAAHIDRNGSGEPGRVTPDQLGPTVGLGTRE